MSAPPRFLCDRMLLHLARWLRAAGYDAAAASDEDSDAALLRRAAVEARCLLTRDRALAGQGAMLVPAQLDAAAQALAERCGVDWLFRPFSRCVACNGTLVLQPAAPKTLASEPQALGLWHCPDCKRSYWQGSHVARMRRWLAFWRAAYPPVRKR